MTIYRKRELYFKHYLWSYTQAVILWGIPEEERETFIAEHDVASMSTRELKLAVLERDQALNEKAEIQNALTTNQGTVTEITSERDELEYIFCNSKKRNVKIGAQLTKRQIYKCINASKSGER